MNGTLCSTAHLDRIFISISKERDRGHCERAAGGDEKRNKGRKSSIDDAGDKSIMMWRGNYDKKG